MRESIDTRLEAVEEWRRSTFKRITLLLTVMRMLPLHFLVFLRSFADYRLEFSFYFLNVVLNGPEPQKRRWLILQRKMMCAPLSVAVIGGGTAGLAVAIALRQQGHEVTVLERHDTLLPVGAGILMQPPGVANLHLLGCGDAFIKRATRVDALQAHNHKGSLLFHIPFGETPAYGVCRGNLTTVLQERSRQLGIRLVLGASIENIVNDTAAASVTWATRTVGKSADSHREPFDLVVVASGSGSALAEPLGFGEAASPYAWGTLNALMTIEPGTHAHPHELRQRVRGGRVMMGLMPSGTTADGKSLLSLYWSLPVAELAAWKAAPFEEFRERQLLGLWPEARSALSVLRREDVVFATYRHAWPRSFVRGRVVLAGDIAHAMSPQLGLGSTLAIEDALTLGHVLSLDASKPHTLGAALAAGGGLSAARSKIDAAAGPSRDAAFVTALDAQLKLYERLRRTPCQQAQLASRALTPLFQSSAPAAVRDAMFLVGRRLPGVQYIMESALRLGLTRRFIR